MEIQHTFGDCEVMAIQPRDERAEDWLGLTPRKLLHADPFRWVQILQALWKRAYKENRYDTYLFIIDRFDVVQHEVLDIVGPEIYKMYFSKYWELA